MRLFLSVLIWTFLASQPGRADWNDTQISNIISDVGDIKEDLIDDGKLKAIVGDLHLQLEDFRKAHDDGLLADVIREIVALLQDRKADYDDFVFGINSTEKCGAGSKCSIFKNDLNNFFDGLAALGERFPAIERLGIDGSRGKKAVDKTPAFLLLGLHNLMERLDRWQDFPADLQALADEVGDDAFTDFMDPFSRASMTATAASATSGPAASIPGLGRTSVQEFCAEVRARDDSGIDPIRLSRLQLYFSFVRNNLGAISDMLSADVGASILGEGTDSIPSPFKALAVVNVAVFDTVQAAVQTRRANVQRCRDRDREMELHVAQCIWLADYVVEENIREVESVITKVIDTSAAMMVEVERSRDLLALAGRKIDGGKYNQGYVSLCSAYQMIGQ